MNPSNYQMNPLCRVVHLFEMQDCWRAGFTKGMHNIQHTPPPKVYMCAAPQAIRTCDIYYLILLYDPVEH
jgi:hypothetical protein